MKKALDGAGAVDRGPLDLLDGDREETGVENDVHDPVVVVEKKEPGDQRHHDRWDDAGNEEQAVDEIREAVAVVDEKGQREDENELPDDGSSDVDYGVQKHRPEGSASEKSCEVAQADERSPS